MPMLYLFNFYGWSVVALEFHGRKTKLIVENTRCRVSSKLCEANFSVFGFSTFVLQHRGEDLVIDDKAMLVQRQCSRRRLGSL